MVRRNAGANGTATLLPYREFCLAWGCAGANGKAVDPRLSGGVSGIGLIAVVALWALIALGPQLKSGNDGKGHALSRGAPGFAAIVDLAERAGADVELRRRIERWRGGEWQPLLILTPTHEALPGEVAGLIDAQGEAPVLVVDRKSTRLNSSH